MNTLDKNKVGLALGLFMGLFHAVWAILVALNWAKPFMDWILHLHLMTLSYTVGPFHFMTAVWLVVVTFVIGYIGGWVLAAIWNWSHKQ